MSYDSERAMWASFHFWWEPKTFEMIHEQITAFGGQCKVIGYPAMAADGTLRCWFKVEAVTEGGDPPPLNESHPCPPICG